MSSPEFILASGSPRRRQLLLEAEYQFSVLPPHESAEAGICSSCGPAELVATLAERKSDDVQRQLATKSKHSPITLLAADTVAECQGMILGKPSSEDHARDMLLRMSGREHRVYTGFEVRLLHGQELVKVAREVVVTTLVMDTWSPGQLEHYLDSGAWEGKAGAFGYQDGLDWVHVVSGSESNVVGLPMEEVCLALAQVGVQPGK